MPGYVPYPVNKRYLIINQRYNLLTAINVHWDLALDVVAELENQKLSQLKISAIQLLRNIKLYDLRNNIYEQLINLQAALMLKRQVSILVLHFYVGITGMDETMVDLSKEAIGVARQNID